MNADVGGRQRFDIGEVGLRKLAKPERYRGRGPRMLMSVAEVGYGIAPVAF